MIFFIDVGFWLILLGLGAILAAGLPIAPPVFRLLIRLLRIDRLSPKIGTAAANLETRTSLVGWLLLPFSWLLVGLSLWATIQLIAVGNVPLEQVPRLTACAGLAVVAGFLSMTPGGLGVREIVLVAILAPIDPAFNSATTLIVAVTLRLVWLVTELLLTIILKVLGWVTGAQPGPITDPGSSNPESTDSESPDTPSPTEE